MNCLAYEPMTKSLKTKDFGKRDSFQRRKKRLEKKMEKKDVVEKMINE